MKSFKTILTILSLTFPLCAQEGKGSEEFLFVGNGYVLTGSDNICFSGKIGYTKYFPTHYSGKYHWQVLNPECTIGYTILPWLTTSILINYNLLFVRAELGDLQINRHEILLSPNVLMSKSIKVFSLGLGINCNNRIFLSQKADGVNIGQSGEIDPASFLPQKEKDYNDDFERYMIYLSVDMFCVVRIKMIKPHLDYKFTLHKNGFYHQMSSGININFLKNRMTIALSDIIKFYQPDIRNYIHCSVGFNFIRPKSD